MINQPKVSIVTPSYNAMQYIQETVESIHSQGYPNMEHIIFDGGSKDGTTEWVTTNYPQIIYTSEKDRGQSHALNKGFQRATGEIIGWLNADDVYMPGAIQKAVDYLVAHPEVDMVCTDIQIIDGDSKLAGVSKSKNFDINTLLIHNFIKQPTVFFRKTIITKLKGVDESLHFVMDREFWLRIALNGFNIKYLSGELFSKFRLCEGTKTFEQTPKFKEEWETVLQRLMENKYPTNIKLSNLTTAVKKNKSSFLLKLAIKAIEKKETTNALKHLLNAAKIDNTLFSNKGYWYYAILALFKRPINHYRRFQKN